LPVDADNVELAIDPLAEKADYHYYSATTTVFVSVYALRPSSPSSRP
jgi:hypothetical protein